MVFGITLAVITVVCNIKPTQTPNSSQFSSHTTEKAELFGPYDVVRVVDGDTIVVNIDGIDTKIRFIGVDTPESVNPNRDLNTENGKIASDWTKSKLQGQQVYLEYDTEKKDKYDRTLAYVFFSDGVTMIQNELLINGLATTMTIPPNTKYYLQFQELESKAREDNIGFWAD